MMLACIAPTLKPGDIVVMDNVSAHKVSRCRSISRKGNVMSRFIGLGEKIAASLHADDAILDGEVIVRLTDSYNPCARRLKIENPGYSQNEGRRELFDKARRRRYRLDKLIAARRRCPGV
jgi:hypothetical protein